MNLKLTVLFLMAAVTAFGAAAEEAIPGRPLISGRIDEGRTVRPEGNVRPEVALATARRAVADDLFLEHIHLQLRRSPAQERAVAAFVDSLTDPTSPNYHRWLTADQFGRRFGVAQSDIDRITGWLRSKGLRVNLVYPSRMVIDFSGTAGQVARAFQTEIQRLDVDGASHIANIGNPAIPVALAPAVEGVVSLHDFRARNKMHKPAVTGNCGGYTCYDMAPGDLATIYGLNPLFAAGYTGKGVSIAVIEDTNLYSNSDWSTFRNVFGLTQYTSATLQTVHPQVAGKALCQNPGIVSGNDGEATLDVEWASAAAPGAAIILASCADTQTTDGIYLATQNLVNGTSPPAVISISYGICEVDDGAAENASFSKLYQQAAAEGISVFVATGDTGASDCAQTRSGTTTGIGVNGWATSYYNVAVGGTDFRDTYDGTNAAYWKASTGAPWSTARSYVPEIPWNDTCASSLIAIYYGGTSQTYGTTGFCNLSAGSGFRLLGGGEGGASECFSGQATIPHVVSGTCKKNPKPAWQAGLFGVPNDGARDVPDVALFASDGSAWSHNYATCFTDPNGGGPCTGNPVTWAGNAGGTSYATPVMAGVQAVIDQYKRRRMGNPLGVYYALAKSEYGNSGNSGCSANLGNKIGAGCIFRDIVSGDIVQDCTGSYDCYRPSGTYGVLSLLSTANLQAYKARAGFDLATGIGSVNAYNLARAWPN